MMLTALFHGVPVALDVLKKQVQLLPLDTYDMQVMRSVTYSGLLGCAVVPAAVVTFSDAVSRFML